MLLNNQQITEEIKKNQNMHKNKQKWKHDNPNLWDSVKSVLRGRFIAIQAYIKKQEKNQTNNLTLHLRQLEKEEMKKPRVSRREEITKIRAEINERGKKGLQKKINKTKIWFIEKINKIDKPLARFIKKKREKNQINRFRNDNEEITTDNTETQRIMRLLSVTIFQ